MKLAFINIPLQNLDFPPAAASLLTGIVEQRLGWNTKIFDFNMYLNSSVDKDTWVELERYWRSTIEDISQDTRKKLESTLEEYAKQLQEYDPDWLAISVFSRWSTVACYEVV